MGNYHAPFGGGHTEKGCFSAPRRVPTLQIKPSSKKASGWQNVLKQTAAVLVLPVSLWTFSWLSGVAAQWL